MERRSGDRACRPSRPTVVPSVCAGGMAAGACSVGWEHALTHLLKSSLSGVSAWLDTNLPGAAGIFLCPFETAGSHRRMGGLSRRRASGRGWRSTFYKCAHECTERCICHSSTHSPLKQQRAIVALVVRVASAAHCNVFVCEAIVRRPRQRPPAQAERASASCRRLQQRPYWQLRTGVRIRVRVRNRLLSGIRTFRIPEGRL
jgi:hypothetical protein